MVLHPSSAAPQPLQRLLARGQGLYERLQHLGLKGHQSPRQQEQILILNTVNLLAILPVQLVLGCSYALGGHWRETLLMAGAFGLAAAFMTGHGMGKIDFCNYRQGT